MKGVTTRDFPILTCFRGDAITRMPHGHMHGGALIRAVNTSDGFIPPFLPRLPPPFPSISFHIFSPPPHLCPSRLLASSAYLVLIFVSYIFSTSLSCHG